MRASCYDPRVRLASIHVYPVKGTRAISLERSDVLRSGLRHDRRFMVLAEDGTFLTQRSHPRLALVDVGFIDHALTIGGAVNVPLDDEAYRHLPRRRAKVWDDEVEAVEVPGDASELFSDHLGEPCTLVYMPDDVVRPVEAPYGKTGDRVRFADAYPVLVASLASLADLNERLVARGEPPVPMDRFRPNLVVEGGGAYDEERYARAEVGALGLRLAKRCARCQVTTVDQRTAEVGKEPLRTLAAYRTEANKVYFAMNAIPEGEAAITVGDRVRWDTPL